MHGQLNVKFGMTQSVFTVTRDLKVCKGPTQARIMTVLNGPGLRPFYADFLHKAIFGGSPPRPLSLKDDEPSFSYSAT